MFPKFVFLTLLCCTLAAVDQKDVGNANDYIDGALNNLRKEPQITKQFDPLNVPGGVNDSKFKLKNIKVMGLSNLFRHGDCSLSATNETITIQVEIAVRDLRVTMDYRAKALFFWINGNALVTVDKAAVKCEIENTNGKAKVHSFKVTTLGPYRVRKITGLSAVLNWLLKIIANSAAQKSKGSIINALETEGKKALNGVLEKYKLPIYYM